MLEPTGPLPPEIYWRRRLVALGGLATVLVLLAWFVISLSHGGQQTSNQPAASLTALPPVPSSAVLVPDPPADAETATQAAPPVPATTQAQVAPAVAAGQCPDQSMAIKVGVEQPTYQVGQQPVFQIVITNISTSACQRDLNQQQVMVTSLDGQKRLWANTDCYPPGPANLQTLNPGQQAAFRVNWAGSTSQPACAGSRVPVPAGSYTAVAQLGALRSAPEPFNIAK
ncbi:MAG: hypothetical protein HOQ24_10310 [Mycobacteriaceae bacterium]|nr:hypothetical protein [Mycobacteriaceae bacterium]